MPFAGRKHRRHDDRARVHRAALKGVVEVLAMRGSAIDEGGACSAEPTRMADCRAVTLVIAPGKRALDVVLLARGNTEAGNIDQKLHALFVQRLRQLVGAEHGNRCGQMLGDRGGGKFFCHECQLLRKRTLPKPGMRLTVITTANVINSMPRPITEIAPRSPLSLRSKMSTDKTFVSDVNRMIAADNSRITPTKMKHQVAITPVRRSGAVICHSERSLLAPRMRLASSSSG